MSDREVCTTSFVPHVDQFEVREELDPLWVPDVGHGSEQRRLAVPAITLVEESTRDRLAGVPDLDHAAEDAGFVRVYVY